MHPSPAASRVVRAVDSLLHAMDRRYKATCPGAQGFCRNMTSIVLEGGTRLAGVRFEYEGGIISFGDSDNMELSLVVMSYQPSELLLVGTYRSTGLSMNTSNVKFFTSGGLPLTLAQPNWQCRDCACVNVVTGNTTSGGATAVSDERFPFQSGLWWSQQGVMVMEVWSYAVLGISVAGALVTFVFILFVLFKVWQGALAKRYIGLGLLLLLAVILLYLSALPFVITPSPTVCGLRYVCPALAYGLCFAVILVKLMALQDYRRIGLGGELSGVNQGLSVFFIVLVQVSISLQWWWFHQPFLLQADGPREGRKRFACDFDRRSFILCLAFVIFLVLLCSVYSVTVRKEKKNAGEARLLLLCCWLTAAVWLTWVSMVMALEARWAPLLCSVGVLATASAVLLIVFVPKVRLVARLKYDLHKKHAGRSGYSVDTDFLYERPYSLPGTLTSTYSSIRTYPKSVTANFDSSLSY
ncbi:metabotropic glutamate receptor 3-like [Pomacea canaliculata]|nr:metabotropic glutamate receptor 3-like [Pomacea canaliculata]